MGRFLRTAIGIILLPMVAATARAFYEQFAYIDINFTQGQIYFLWGIAAYCLFQLLLIKPMFIYILGHECVHVLATWLCFGRVTSFNVSSKGGSVSTSKSNFFIKMSPYFVPLYSILLTLVYYVVVKTFVWGFLAKPYFMFLFGATLAFHIVMTADAAKTKQPDFIRMGHLNALIFIFLVNLVLISAVLGLLFESFSVTSFLKKSYAASVSYYIFIYNWLAGQFSK